MPRPPRLEFEGAFYHIFSRGNNRQPIFYSDDDRNFFLKVLEECREKFQVKMFAFCLLTTHFHLLLETEKPNLSKLMHDFLTRYAVYIKRKYAAEGHIFQGRYHAILCDKDAYFLALTRYIHLNPYRAGLCDRASDYPWSSFSAYFNLPCKYPLKIDTSPLLQVAGGREAYFRFLQDEIEGLTPMWEPRVHRGFLGSAEFIKKVLERVKRKGWEKMKQRALHGRFWHLEKTALEQLVNAVSQFYQISPEMIRGASRVRKIARARGVLAYLARQKLGLSLSSLAEYLGGGEGKLYYWMSKVQRNEKWKQEVERILK